MRLRVVDNLSKPVNGIVEPVVEAMHEDEHFAAAGLLCCGSHGGGELLFVDVVRRNRHKIVTRIARKRFRPLDFATLSGAVRWN